MKSNKGLKQQWKKRRIYIAELVDAGLTYSEIGQMLGLTKQAVYNVIMRAKMKTPAQIRKEKLQYYLKTTKVN